MMITIIFIDARFRGSLADVKFILFEDDLQILSFCLHLKTHVSMSIL